MEAAKNLDRTLAIDPALSWQHDHSARWCVCVCVCECVCECVSVCVCVCFVFASEGTVQKCLKKMKVVLHPDRVFLHI